MAANFYKYFLSGHRLFRGEDLNALFNVPKMSSEDLITAKAGGGKALAYPLTATMNRISVAASAADSVLLPQAIPGVEITIINAGANAIQVFGQGTDTINGVATGTGVSQAAGTTTTFRCSLLGTWYGTGGVSGAGNFTTLSASGIITPTGGIAAAGGSSISPRTIHAGGKPAITLTDGTDTTPVVTETYFTEFSIPCNMTISGLALLNGSAVAGNVTATLYTAAGVPIAAALSVSTAQAGVAGFQLIPFATPYAGVGPVTLYGGFQFNNTSARFRSFAAGTFGANKKTGETYGVITSITPPTTFNANLGPMFALF